MRKLYKKFFFDWKKKTEEMVSQFTEKLSEDRENRIKEELIKLGWTPPDKKRDAHLTDLCRRLVALDPPKRYGESVMSVLHEIAAIVGEKGIPKGCKCHADVRNPNCPVHGQKEYGFHRCLVCGEIATCGTGNALMATKHYCDVHRPGTKPDPDPPLRVKVARALGKDVIFPRTRHSYWCIDTAPGSAWRSNKQIETDLRNPVPPYDTDLKAAMDALEEYSENNACVFIIRRNRAGGYEIQIYPLMGNDLRWSGSPLSTAICEAIVEHAKQSKHREAQ